MRILFVDPVCNKSYDNVILDSEPLGGTEATVVRIAHGLAKRNAQVEVTQHNREQFALGFSDAADKNPVQYSRFGAARDYKPTHVVVLRAPMALYQARKQFPNAKLYLWCHDMFGGAGWDKGFQAMVDTQAVPILVSEWHKGQMYDFMTRVQFQGSIPSRRIYNPIADDLQPDGTPVDANKLVFFSSPHKGLERTLEVFDKFQNFDELKDMQLYIANPGYYADHETKGLRNVVNLGALSHATVISQVRSALAVFHLNAVFPETMGIVHSEANAVGTPFLSSRLGATPEVADHVAEMIDVNDTKAVIDRILMWKRDGRPKVRGNPNFRLKNVIRDWLDLLRL